MSWVSEWEVAKRGRVVFGGSGHRVGQATPRDGFESLDCC